MRDIAREVGVEAASLYNHISSKQLILSDLLLEIGHLFTIGMERIQKQDLSNLEKLEALIKLHVDITVSNTNAISLLPSEWVHLEEPSLKQFITLKDAYEKEFKSIITGAIAEGQIKSLDADLTLFSILSTLRWLYSWYSKYDEISIDQLKKELIQSLIYGVKTYTP